jgi:dGTPase
VSQPENSPPANGPVGNNPGDRWRAPYACDPAQTRGRSVEEPSSPTRSAFQRDRDRIIHCTAFRRLKHKTQVFIEHEGDHYRTRLTHTLEVSQIARSLARALGLDEDLAETIALAHDLGHTPFGHAGERALDRCLADAGGFDHNAQSLKVVTSLERRYADFDGLNLSWETLEGLVKHNGPLVTQTGETVGAYFGKGLPRAIAAYDFVHPLDLWNQPGGEAQAAAIADDIAYIAHDIDDGLRAGAFELTDLRAVPFLGELLENLRWKYPKLEMTRMVHELQRRVITALVEDVITQSVSRLKSLNPQSAADLRGHYAPVIAFSAAMDDVRRATKSFLFRELYRHERVMKVMNHAESVVEDLFATYADEPELLSEEWQRQLEGQDGPSRAIIIGDYIAGMTDRYALEAHARLFDSGSD